MMRHSGRVVVKFAMAFLYYVRHRPFVDGGIKKKIHGFHTQTSMQDDFMRARYLFCKIKKGEV